MITAILAQSTDMVIGTTGRDGPCLPWSLPPDLKRFRKLTTGHAVIMGRKTFDSIGKPLPNRRNIVVSRMVIESTGAEWAPDPATALEMAVATDPDPFIIGGASIYSALWSRIERVELTRVYTSVGLGLVFAWDPTLFVQAAESHCETHDGLGYQFVTLDRTGPWIDRFAPTPSNGLGEGVK